MPDELAERVAYHLANARRLRGPDGIHEELLELDEDMLGRRRLASEERRYRRLVRELAVLGAPDTRSETR